MTDQCYSTTGEDHEFETLGCREAARVVALVVNHAFGAHKKGHERCENMHGKAKLLVYLNCEWMGGYGVRCAWFVLEEPRAHLRALQCV